MKNNIPILILFSTLLATTAQAGFIETFDAAATLADTHFSTAYLAGTGQFQPDNLAAISKAPSDTRLPVAAGTDQEKRKGACVGIHDF